MNINIKTVCADLWCAASWGIRTWAVGRCHREAGGGEHRFEPRKERLLVQGTEGLILLLFVKLLLLLFYYCYFVVMMMMMMMMMTRTVLSCAEYWTIIRWIFILHTELN